MSAKRKSYRRSQGYSSYGRRKKSKSRKWLILLLVMLPIVAAGAFLAYAFLSPASKAEEPSYIYIRPETSLEELELQLNEKAKLKYPRVFHYAAKYYKLGEKLRPGRYGINKLMNQKQLLQSLAHGRQTAVKLQIAPARLRSQMAERSCKELMLEPKELLSAMADTAFCQSLGFDTLTIDCMILPDTYEVYWDTNAKDLLKKLHRYYQRFWTPERLAKADSIGLTPKQVAVLASIIEEESAKPDEYAAIAGLYLNRLRIGMRLQADPTVKFAVGDFTLKRILNKHLYTPSPYNTYLEVGLPPGPIRYSLASTQEAVLNAQKHKYLYMVAKEDFSGRHNFAEGYAEHMQNARRYQRALNERGIR